MTLKKTKGVCLQIKFKICNIPFNSFYATKQNIILLSSKSDSKNMSV